MVAAKAGRPIGRRETLLQAAAEVFFEQGYVATSIDAIIERAGGPKRNICSEFGSKEGLFAAIVTNSADTALSTLAIDETEERDLRETLTAFGRQLMDIYMSPTGIGVYRIAVTEAIRFPDLVRSFYEQGPGRAASQLAKVLELAQTRGEIRTDDCQRAAGHFVGMIRDNLHLQAVLGLRPPLSDKEVRKVVASAGEIFLNGGSIRPAQIEYCPPSAASFRGPAAGAWPRSDCLRNFISTNGEAHTRGVSKVEPCVRQPKT